MIVGKSHQCLKKRRRSECASCNIEQATLLWYSAHPTHMSRNRSSSRSKDEKAEAVSFQENHNTKEAKGENVAEYCGESTAVAMDSNFCRVEKDLRLMFCGGHTKNQIWEINSLGQLPYIVYPRDMISRAFFYLQFILMESEDLILSTLDWIG